MIEIRNYMEEVRQKYNYGVISFFLTLFVLASIKNIFYLNAFPELVSFNNHIISMATVNGYDVSKKISIAYAVVLVIVTCTFLGNSILKKIFAKHGENEKDEFLILLNQLSILGVISIILSYLMNIQDSAIYYIGIFLSIILILSYLSINNIINIDIVFAEWSCLVSIAVLIFIKTIWSQSGVKFGEILVISISIFGCILCKALLDKKSSLNIEWCSEFLVIKATLPIIATIAVQSIIIELSNILSTRGIIEIINLKIIYLIIMALSIMSGVIIGYINYINICKCSSSKNYKNKAKEILHKYGYTLTLIGILLIILQPNNKIIPWAEYFETANHGLGLDGLFRYGKIPIIETFDAHMLLNQIWGVIYSILNGYEPWAVMLYNNYWILVYNLITYYCFNPLLGKRITFLMLIILPKNIIPQQYILVVLPLLYIYRKLKKDKFNNIIFWILIGMVCLLSLDLGIISIIAGISTYIILNVIEGNNKLKVYLDFIWSALLTAGVAAMVFVFLCLIKGINPILRIREFLDISLSNQNWAYTFLGDTQSIAFNLWYYIIPICFTLCAIVVISGIIEKRFELHNNRFNIYAICAFIFFTVAYYVNFSRGLVRHSLAENRIEHVAYFVSLAIISICVMKKNKYTLLIFSTNIIMLTLLGGINNTQLTQTSSLVHHLKNSIEDMSDYEKRLTLNESRVEGELINDKDAKRLRSILDLLLTKEETYIDMTSLNYFYALVERPNPVYVNQSPLLLNGDFTQEIFIEQIKETSAPIVIMPLDGSWREIDGVNVLDKYYLITKYIYDNYEPIYKLDKFEIWGEKNSAEQFKRLLEEEAIFKMNEMVKDNIKVNEGIVHYTDEEIVLEETGEDAYIWDILPKDFYKVENMKEEYQIEIQVDANNNGVVQIYYSTALEGFTEEKSIRKELNKPGFNIISLVTSECPRDLRIDIEGIGKLEIKDIRIYKNRHGQFISVEDSINIIGSHNQGLVPWYWGKEQNDLYDRKEIVDIGRNEDLGTIYIKMDTNQDLNEYLNLEIKSQEEQMLTIILRNDKAEYQEQQYTMMLKEGEYNYRLQLGSIYGYYLGKYNSLELIAEKSEISVSTCAEEKKRMLYPN